MSNYVPDPQSGAGKALGAWRHLNYRLSRVLPRYLHHSDRIAYTVRKSPTMRKRGG
jgi:hypothetical protein